MACDKFTARATLNATHAAWSNGDIDRVLVHYVDDLTYWCNSGGPNGAPLTIVGKSAFRAFLAPIAAAAESVSVAEYFRFEDGAGRAQIECYIKHKQTGLSLSGSYRQVVMFAGGRICRVCEYHDAAKMAAFWRLVAGEMSLYLPADGRERRHAIAVDPCGGEDRHARISVPAHTK
jgi:ketosteroid isomerase-like protein